MNWAVMRLGRVAAAALLIAAGYSAALVAGAFLAPMYQSSVSSSGEVTHGPGTLIGVNGFGVVAVIGMPLLVSLAVGCALLSRSRRTAMPLAWALTGLLAVFNLLAMLSIGVFVLPVTAALIVACSTRRPPPVPAVPTSAASRPDGTP